MKALGITAALALLTTGAAWGLQETEGGPARGQSRLGEDGRVLFQTYCASCHGPTGFGNGPLADQLRRRPADLTAIALRNGGLFPTARVHRIIDGREVEAHGDQEMPVWGDAFKTTRDGFSEESVHRRIAALVAYLQTIQRMHAH
jgi:mono/diheme cytochrome c family protein